MGVCERTNEGSPSFPLLRALVARDQHSFLFCKGVKVHEINRHELRESSQNISSVEVRCRWLYETPVSNPWRVNSHTHPSPSRTILRPGTTPPRPRDITSLFLPGGLLTKSNTYASEAATDRNKRRLFRTNENCRKPSPTAYI